ncbi:hypothetical protein NYQ10_19935 [Flavobacterium johnsoniae]|uniref:hypothetical protein n=1 Tax=Flavobacterium johnsoniae TaxID=986 RepID=UPI0025AF4ADB|nr:hypothetical protein [Flavobacterium johnsoniae]WJS94357.1 hypothetical protein NYQ10_19935 [Flavobacterium johnsoniae]
MNKKIKYIIIALNIIVLVIAVNWYLKDKNEEPLIAIITQFIALIVLFFEEKLSKVTNIKNENTDIDTDISGDNNVEVMNKKNKDSNIRTTIR